MNDIDEPPASTNDQESALTTNLRFPPTPLQSETTETGPPAEHIVQEICITPGWATSKGVRIPLLIWHQGTEDTMQTTFILFSLCIAIAIATTDQGGISPPLPPVSFPQIISGMGANFDMLIDMIALILGWVSFASPIDCVIPWEGGRIISELTSPGLGDSQSWLYRTVLGLTAVPVDAVLDPRLPHWAFLGDSGHITLELHTNATVSTVIIESDFPESMPHDVHVWAFVPKIKQGRRNESLQVTPPLLHQFEDRGLFPLFLGNLSLGEGSVPGDHRYHIHRQAQAYTPTMVVMLEFLSNGGADITRIRLIRILGIPS